MWGYIISGLYRAFYILDLELEDAGEYSHNFKVM